MHGVVLHLRYSAVGVSLSYMCGIGDARFTCISHARKAQIADPEGKASRGSI